MVLGAPALPFVTTPAPVPVVFGAITDLERDALVGLFRAPDVAVPCGGLTPLPPPVPPPAPPPALPAFCAIAIPDNSIRAVVAARIFRMTKSPNAGADIRLS